MKKYVLFILSLLMLLPCAALAEDGVDARPVGQPPADPPAWQGGPYKWYTEDFIPAQHFTLQPDIFTYAGYRFVGLDGKRRAAEYDYLHPSFAGGLSVHEYPLPFMVDIDADYLNEHDHNATVNLAFTDIFKINYQSTELFHNLDHYRFIDSPSLDKDPNAQYGVNVNINDIKAVFKTPFIPFHLYVEAREFSKEGEVQQRFNSFLVPNAFGGGKTSEDRTINWVTDELTMGFNGNVLSLFEIDYHHIIKHFEARGDKYLINTYTGLGGPTDLAHNLTPTIESHYDTVSVHTDQSKALTAAGTFTYVTKNNEFSRAKVDSHREYGDVSYRITDSLMVSAKYGHQRIQADNSGAVDHGLPYNIAVPTDVANPLITRTEDRGIASLVYQPARLITVTAQYTIDHITRTNTDAWGDPTVMLISKPSSTTHTGRVALMLEPMKHTKVHAAATYVVNGDPSYNVDYRQAWEANTWATYVPLPGLVINADYKMIRGYNPVQNWRTNSQPVDNLNRHDWKDNGGAGVQWYAVQGLVLGAHYDYIRNKVSQTELYEDTAGNLAYSFNEPWRDTSHGYTVFGKYCFPFPLSVQAEFSQSWDKSGYTISQILGGHITTVNADNVDDFTLQRIRDTKVNVRADYEITHGWGVALGYGMSQYTDLTRPQTVEDRNGTAHFGTVYLTKKWL